MSNDEQGKVQLVIAAVMAVVTDWERAEERAGRRGPYRTTGANMVRFKEVDEESQARVESACASLGIEVDPDGLADTFKGDYEYQFSFACNRFVSKSGSVAGVRLTATEMRTVEKLRVLAEKKPQAVQDILRRAA